VGTQRIVFNRSPLGTWRHSESVVYVVCIHHTATVFPGGRRNLPDTPVVLYYTQAFSKLKDKNLTGSGTGALYLPQPRTWHFILSVIFTPKLLTTTEVVPRWIHCSSRIKASCASSNCCFIGDHYWSSLWFSDKQHYLSLLFSEVLRSHYTQFPNISGCLLKINLSKRNKKQWDRKTSSSQLSSSPDA